MALFLSLLFSLYLGLYWGIFSQAVFLIQKYNMPFKIILIPCIWVILEYLKAHLLTGIPWLLIGYSLWKIPLLIQISSFTGIYGLSFIILYLNTSIALSLKSRRLSYLVSGIILWIAVIIYGIYSMPNDTLKDGLKISILQGNISQYKKWNWYYENEILKTYKSLHLIAEGYKPDLIIWPETALPFELSEDNKGISLYMKKIIKPEIYELVGSNESSGENYYNSAYIVSPEGVISEPYRKINLVPFGEYVPLQELISPIIDVINEIGGFNAGTRYKLLNVKGFNIGIGICFESAFPEHSRKFFKKGADIFINMTNDGYFWDTAGPYQHFIHSIFRAVENRCYVIRAANTGISAIIAPSGRVVKKTNLLERVVLNGKVERNNTKTFYTKYGDVFVGSCMFFVIAAILLSSLKPLLKKQE